MDWKQYYQSHRMTAQEAVRLIKSGDRVFLTGNCSVPLHLLSALVEHAPNLQNVELCQALTVAGSEYVSPEMEGHLRVNSFFVSNNVRKAIHEGKADFTLFYFRIPLLFQKEFSPLDVALVHISPPDDDGYCRLGIEAGLTRNQAESAKLVIAQVNKQMPNMMGDTLFHVTKLGAIVEVDEPLAKTFPMTNDTDHQLVQRITRLS